MERHKSEFKHKSLETLSILACFLLILGVMVWALELPQPFAPEQRARWRVKVVGYSLWQIELNKEKEGGAIPAVAPIAPWRGLASVGSRPRIGLIGRDPWNHPYHYHIKQNSSLLFVWSLGPNGKDESGDLTSTFHGDDIGYILDLKAKRE